MMGKFSEELHRLKRESDEKRFNWAFDSRLGTAKETKMKLEPSTVGMAIRHHLNNIRLSRQFELTPELMLARPQEITLHQGGQAVLVPPNPPHLWDTMVVGADHLEGFF